MDMLKTGQLKEVTGTAPNEPHREERENSEEEKYLHAVQVILHMQTNKQTKQKQKKTSNKVTRDVRNQITVAHT